MLSVEARNSSTRTMNEFQMSDRPSKLRRMIPWLFGFSAILLPATLYIVNETSWFDEPEPKCERHIDAENARRIALELTQRNPSLYAAAGYQTFEQFTAALSECGNCLSVSDRRSAFVNREKAWSVEIEFPKSNGKFVVWFLDLCGSFRRILQN